MRNRNAGRRATASRHRLAFECLETRRVLAYGEVDLAFGVDGKQIYTLDHARPFDDFVQASAPGDSGSLWMGGTSADRGTLLHLRSDGKVNTAFDGDGFKSFNFESANKTEVTALKPLSDGSVLAVGQLTYISVGQPFVAKFSPTGELDTSFGQHGLWLGSLDTRISLFESSSEDVYLLEHEWLGANQFTRRGYRIIKLTDSGALATEFGKLGKTEQIVAQNAITGSVVDPLFLIHDEHGLSYGFIQPFNDGRRELHTLRYDLSGDRDSSFGSDGMASADVGTLIVGNWFALGDGNFIVLDRITYPASKITVRKFNFLTGFDQSFSQLEFPLASDRFFQGTGLALRQLANDTWQVTWSVSDRLSTSSWITSTVFDLNGNLDTSYGIDGLKQVLFPNRMALVSASVGEADFQYLVGTVDFPRDISVLALATSGELESTFGDQGSFRIDLTEESSFIHAFEIHGHGRSDFVASSKPGNAGNSFPGEVWRSNLRQSQTSMTMVPYEFFSFTEGKSHLLKSGKLVVAQHRQLASQYAITLDVFGLNGALENRLEVAAPYFIDSFQFVDLPSGEVLLLADAYGAQSQSEGLGYAILIKLSETGTLVETFADQGIKRLSELPNRVSDLIPVEGGYRLILSNMLANDEIDKMFVFAVDGNADPLATFGTDGIVQLLPSMNRKRHVAGVNSGSDLLLLINAEGDYQLMKIREDGQLDASFGSAGIQSLPLTPVDWLAPVQIEWNGNDLVIAASATRDTDADSFVEILVTNSLGHPNETFGTGGLLVLNPFPSQDEVTNVVPLLDGSLLIGMQSRTALGPAGVVMRVLGPVPSLRPQYNIVTPLNVSAHLGDDLISPLDALLVINHLNSGDSDEPGYVDTNGDGIVSPLDALLVINYLNQTSSLFQVDGEATQLTDDASPPDVIDELISSVEWAWFEFKPDRARQESQTGQAMRRKIDRT